MSCLICKDGCITNRLPTRFVDTRWLSSDTALNVQHSFDLLKISLQTFLKEFVKVCYCPRSLSKEHVLFLASNSLYSWSPYHSTFTGNECLGCPAIDVIAVSDTIGEHMISVETPDTPAIFSVLYMYRDPCHVVSGQNIFHLVWSEPLETSLNETLVYWEILCWLGAGGCVQWAGAALGSCPCPCLPGSPWVILQPDSMYVLLTVLES